MSSDHPQSSEEGPVSDFEGVQRSLYQLMSNDGLSFDAKVERALDLGREFLGVVNGHVERIDPVSNTHTVVASRGGPEEMLPVGATLDRATTYCRRTLTANEPVAISDAEAEGWGDDPAYQAHGLACYLGAPINVEGDSYGTVCFVDESARYRQFDPAEKAFVELVARLLGRELAADENESELSAIRRKHASLVEAAPDAIFLADAETGRIADANSAAAALTGYDATSLEGMPIQELHPPEKRGAYLSLFEQLEESPETTSTLPDGGQLYIRQADGERVPVEMSATAVELSDGRYVQGIVRDISERLRRRQELDRERELFRYSQQLAGVGGWEFDCRTDELYWTDEVSRIHGLEPGETPSVEEALSFYHPADRDCMEEAFNQAVDEGEPYDLELRIVTDGGETRWVRVRGVPTFQDGEAVRVRGTFQDVTDRREPEQDLRLRTRALDEAGVGVSIAMRKRRTPRWCTSTKRSPG